MYQQVTYYNPIDDFDEKLYIDFKKIFLVIWYRKFFILKIFTAVLLFFVALYFVQPKKYTVEADLYINKSNNTNMTDVNPYIIEDVNGQITAMSDFDKILNNELEIIKSPLVIDKVIQENKFVFTKKWGILPNKREGEYIPASMFIGKGKNPSFEVKKGTNVITIKYKSKNPDLAYNVVCSIITNYIDLLKEFNSEKSKSDKNLIEYEYKKAKSDLNKKLSNVGGLPANAVSGTGNISAMSVFSQSAKQAVSNITGQYAQSERARIEVSEDVQKVANLSSKLEWAKLVENMSDSSKVLVLKTPRKLRSFENSSPKFSMNILLGFVFGIIVSLIALIFAELNDKKLSYSMLGGNVIYDLQSEYLEFKSVLLANKNKKIIFVVCDINNKGNIKFFEKFSDIKTVNAELSENFVDNIEEADFVVLFASVGYTDSKFYKQIKKLIMQTDKKVLEEIIL